MTSTPLWVPIVVAVLGVLGTALGTVGGVLMTQRRADRREATSWNRERSRQRELWAREDAARTFKERQDAYSDFYESLKAMALVAYTRGMGLSDQESLSADWHEPTFRRLQRLELFGTAAAARAAGEVYSVVWLWGERSKFGNDDDAFYRSHDVVEKAEEDFLRVIRSDLAIPHGDPLRSPEVQQHD